MVYGRRKINTTTILVTLLLSFIYTTALQPVEGEVLYEWKNLPPLPTPRTEVTSTVVGNDFYVLGGFEDPGVSSNKVEIFNAANDSWRRGPSLPTPLHHSVAVTLNGKIYVIGGYLEGWIPVDTVYIYDPKDGEWVEGPRLPRAKAAFTAQVVDGKIYTVGGASTRVEGGRRVDEVLGVNEYLDPATNTWHIAAQMPTIREHLASAVVDGKIYIIGGRVLTLESNTDVNEVYDPKTDTWSKKAPMLTKRGGIAMATLSGKIFVFGGESNTRTFKEVEEYTPATDMWRQVEPMPTARHGLTAATLLGKIIVVGGGRQPGIYMSDINEAFMPAHPSASFTSSTLKGVDEFTKVVADDGESNDSLWFLLYAVIAVTVILSAIIYFRMKKR